MTITTGFEDNIAALQDPPDWTTLEQEATYLSELALGNDTVAYSVAGESVESRPLHLLRIGHPVAPTKEQAQQKPCILIVAKQHGNEYAGREAALIFARTLAEATGDLKDFLETHCVLIMPTCNPDSTIRQNKNSVDINRDHLAVSQPESLAIQTVIRDYRPICVIDLHEDNGADNDVAYATGTLDAIAPEIKALTEELIDDYIIPACNAHGYDHAVYSAATDGIAAALRQTGGLRYAVTLLVETDSTLARAFRVQAHIDLLAAAIEYLDDNSAGILSAISAAKAGRVSSGLAGVDPFVVVGDSGAVSIDPPPMGYELTEQQLSDTAVARAIHGIDRIRPRIVSMGQEAMTVVPFLLDSRASGSLVSATPLMSGVPTDPELSGLSVDDNVPSVDCIEASGTVHFITVEHGGDVLDPFDVAQLIQYGVA